LISTSTSKKNKSKILGIALLSVILLSGLIPLIKIESNTNLFGDFPFGSLGTITINSPEQKTYSGPMTGYYPATYGFENDANGADPAGWSVSEGTGITISVVDTQASHRKSLELDDSSSVNGAAVAQSMGTHDGGTVEFWVMSTNAAKATAILIYGTGDLKVHLCIDSNKLSYWDGSNWLQTTCSISNSVWYRISIVYEVVNVPANPPGIPEDGSGISFNVKVNDIKYIDDSFVSDTYPQHINGFWFSTHGTSTGYTSRFDAVGYSWDVDYDAGDNEHQGLLLDFQPDGLSGVEYQLDGGPKYPTLGDTVLRMPYSGNHTVQVFAPGYTTGSSTFTIA
jgi:hypothetical protein